MPRTNMISRGAVLTAFLSLFVAMPASAWIGVGANPGCEKRNVQAAVDEILARERIGDFDDPYIVIAGGTYKESVTINPIDIGGQHSARVTITGGYAADCSGPQQGAVTTIDATGFFRSVLTIFGSTAASLEGVALVGGNAVATGGGIDFEGAGRLDLTRVQIRNNHARIGGGIFMSGNTGETTSPSIYLHHDTDIYQNTADNGGGVYIKNGTKMFMLEGGHISNNKAMYGGGISINEAAQASLGSVEISFNEATQEGGGIELRTNGYNDDDPAAGGGTLSFFMSLPGQPALLQSNTAQYGGGIHISGSQNGECWSGFKIERNVAREGAAIFKERKAADDDGLNLGADAALSSCGSKPGVLPCPAGSICNAIDENRAEWNGNLSGSAVFLQSSLAQDPGTYDIRHVAFRANRGMNLLGFYSAGMTGNFAHVLISDNVTADANNRAALLVAKNGPLRISNSTIAGNTIGGPSVFDLGGDLTLTESLVWQPGKIALTQVAGHQRTVRNVFANEVASLGSGFNVEEMYPQFRDPANGDYHLAANSHALDYAAAAGGTDLDGLPRSVDLPIPNGPGGGPLDLGAFELQGIPVFPPDEKFDGVVAPVLPPLWSNDHSDGGAGWVTLQTNATTPPNVAYTDDTASVTDKSLTSPAVAIVKKGRLRFSHKFDVESPGDFFASDGVVLEISISGGEFVDILRAGGTFSGGGYDHSISLGAPGNNPLKGRGVWSGDTAGAYRNVMVDLPAAADGQSVRLRWRMGTDNGNAAPHVGYFLDDIHIQLDGSDALFCDDFEGSAGCS